MSNHNAISLGRVSEAINAAECATFNAANAASCYLDDEPETEAVDRRSCSRR